MASQDPCCNYLKKNRMNCPLGTSTQLSSIKLGPTFPILFEVRNPQGNENLYEKWLKEEAVGSKFAFSSPRNVQFTYNYVKQQS